MAATFIPTAISSSPRPKSDAAPVLFYPAKERPFRAALCFVTWRWRAEICAGLAEPFYPPFTPPAVSPTTISFWMTSVSTSTGIVTTSAAAASGPQLTCSKVSML